MFLFLFGHVLASCISASESQRFGFRGSNTVDMQGGRPSRPPVPIFGAADRPAVPKFTARVPSPDEEVCHPGKAARRTGCKSTHQAPLAGAALRHGFIEP